MVEEWNTPPSKSARGTTAEAEVVGELERTMTTGTEPGTLKFIVKNLQAACQRTRQLEGGDSEQADPPDATNVPVTSSSSAGSASAEPEEAVAASDVSLIVTELVSTDTWWAQRWIDKATPGEVAAMRELLI